MTAGAKKNSWRIIHPKYMHGFCSICSPGRCPKWAMLAVSRQNQRAAKGSYRTDDGGGALTHGGAVDAQSGRLFDSQGHVMNDIQPP